ncbi:MAG: type II toxin-antitoxin system VapC family toxin [Sporichthyaceae bacterium]
MTAPLVLDAAGLDALCQTVPDDLVRAYLAEAHRRAADVVVPTVVCAELCRGAARTRAVEASLARHSRDRGERPAIRRQDTDLAMARQVGAVLHPAGAGSEQIVDAHVVATCVLAGGGLVLTSDPDDIAALAETVPAIRIVVRRI